MAIWGGGVVGRMWREPMRGRGRLRRHQIPPAPTPHMDMYIPALLCPHDEMSSMGDEEEEGPGVLGPARPA